MAAAVMIPLSTINQNGGILPASAITYHSARHGRTRGMSFKGKSGRGRGYSLVESTEVTVAKAVSFLLKRAISEDDVESDDESDEENHRLVSDAEGWVPAADLLAHPHMRELRADLAGLQQAASSSKARFTLRQQPETDDNTVQSYTVRQNTKRTSVQAPILEGSPLTKDDEDVPEYVVYETTYQAYPLILASGSIKCADGATHSSFSPETTLTRSSAADIGIWIHLPTVLEHHPDIVWQHTTTGSIVTSHDVPKSLWKRVVGRRQDIGILLEDGEVRKEVPDYLRGRGGKGKAKRGKGMLKQEGRVASESDSN